MDRGMLGGKLRNLGIGRPASNADNLLLNARRHNQQKTPPLVPGYRNLFARLLRQRLPARLSHQRLQTTDGRRICSSSRPSSPKASRATATGPPQLGL